MYKTVIWIQKSKELFKDHFNYSRFFSYYPFFIHWIKLVGITGISQVLVQAVGFVSGVLIIRYLTIEEYAFYTIANTLLGTMALLSDGGISAGVLSQGGKVWKDKNSLGGVVVTGLKIRKEFALVSLLICLPILSYLLLENGASWLMVLLISVTLVPAFYAELSDSVLDIVPKLHQDIVPLQKNQLLVGFGRLLLTLTIVVFLPFTYVVLLANGIPRIFGNIKLKKIAGHYIIPQPPDAAIRKKILQTVKKVLPGAIYFCFSGQITIWILSFFGNTTELAHFGALAKITIVLSIVGTMASTLLVPRFARKKENREFLLKFYVQVLCVIMFLLVLGTLFIYLFPQAILWILGPQYYNLELELFYVTLGSAIGVFSGVIVSLNMSRNWIINPAFSISLSLLSLIIGVVWFDVSMLMGVLYLNIFLAVIQLVIHGAFGALKLKQLKLSKTC